VCGVDRTEKALNNNCLWIYQKIKFVLYVPLNFGLGDFLLDTGVK
jgi:hypothetical protein